MTDALCRFQALADDKAGSALLACCASPGWVARMLAARPYASAEELLDTAEELCRGLSPAEVEAALSAHPRIGDRAAGATREATWSRQEQGQVRDADAGVRARLHAGNVAYEQRFGRVFLVRAAGRTPAQMLDELERRLRNDLESEQCEVVEQLAQITRLRVEKLLTA